MQYYGMQTDILNLFAEAQMPSWRVDRLFAWVLREHQRVLNYHRVVLEKQKVLATIAGPSGRTWVTCPNCGNPIETRPGMAAMFHVGPARLTCAGSIGTGRVANETAK